MNKTILLLITTLIFASLSVAHAETIEYEITRISEGNTSTLIAKGKKEYSAEDIIVKEDKCPGQEHFSKKLMLEKGFGIGASIYQEPKLTGFGLWGVIERGRSFSWEWFNLRQPGIFKKLQENGTVSVSCIDDPRYEEIGEIYFSTDISFRINTSQEIGRVTHRILIKKGSILKFTP
ncbi:MAG TPA: hypothetical protein DCX54_08040 [Flavobacteriales bacterium]|nr:hypothetical protein [Flavobacteriales bacterium]